MKVLTRGLALRAAEGNKLPYAPEITFQGHKVKQVRKGYVLYSMSSIPTVGVLMITSFPCVLTGGRIARWLGTQPEVRQT